MKAEVEVEVKVTVQVDVELCFRFSNCQIRDLRPAT